MGLITATNVESTHTHLPVLVGVHLIVFVMVAALPGIAPLFVRKVAGGTRVGTGPAATSTAYRRKGANLPSAGVQVDEIPLNSVEDRLRPPTSHTCSTENITQVTTVASI